MTFYITFVDFKSSTGVGLGKKITAQVEAMELELGEIYYTSLSHSKVYLMNKEKIIEEEIAITQKDCIEVLVNWIQKYHVTSTYIRYGKSTKWFIDLLKYQKQHHIKTILEIPSYPYDLESSDGIWKKVDKYYREEINKYVNMLSTYSRDEKIWGIPCIRLRNGIKVQQIPVHGKDKEMGKIVLIAISSMKLWHGYERILEGMYLYYKSGGKYDLRLKLIGSGPEEQYYRDLADKYKLNFRVEFLGLIKVDEKECLDEQFNLSDIAVGSLGMYKAGYEKGSPIKGAEYCARGIPFICGYHDLRFPQDWEFMLNVSNNSEPVDMNRVIDFYEQITLEKNYKKIMRKYAEDYLTWDSVMKPVVEYLKG